MSTPKFSLNLDGTLKKRSQMQERGEDQPGQYSPRPTTTAAAPPVVADTPPAPSPIPSTLKKHANPTSTVAEAVAAEEAAIGITDPDMDVILSAKSRLSGGAAASERASSAGGTVVAASSGASGGRRAAPLATLVEHQNARQSPAAAAAEAKSERVAAAAVSPLPVSPRKGATGAARGSAGAAGGGAAHAVGHSPTRAASRAAKVTATSPSVAAAVAPGDRSGHVKSVHLEEAYILGRTFRQFVASTSRLSINGITGSNGGGAFHQNPAQYVSAMASCGDYVAIGDRTGHVAVMKRKPMTPAQHSGLIDQERREDDKWLRSIGDREAGAAAPPVPAPRTRDLYDFHVGQQAYTSVIDPLNSVEVTPNVSALAFLPQTSAAAYLLTANEKLPKLYKIMSVRESAMPFRAVDKIDSKTIGPLTAASRASTVAMKPVARYALSHEYNIHSVCPLTDSEQFVTADDLTMQLWCTEYPDTSIETFDIRPPFDEEPREAIRCVRTFPHEPFLLFAATSAGNVRVIDVRQTLRWGSQTAQLFVNPPREADGNFSNVTNSLSDCALSPCGRYIAGRDFMTACLWDVRVAGSSFPSSPSRRTASSSSGSGAAGEYNVVQRWELHPHLRSDLETLYQSDLLFERFDVQFVSPRQVSTGGFGNALYTIDVTQGEGPAGGRREEGATAGPSAGVELFQLPTNEGVADVSRVTMDAKPASAWQPPNATAAPTGLDGVKNGAAGGNALALGSRITLLSRPTMSLGGTCCMLLCCGQVVMQLSYTSL